jgi:NAD(P)-dependent dehydrogenase (short-subunit alcohol dehydrogenase family)
VTGRAAGKRALVTGAAQGLGAAIAGMLAREGAQVAVTDVNGDGAGRTAAAINARNPGAATAYEHDVSDEAQWTGVLGQAARDLGGLSVLVNNAGVGALGSVEQETLEGWRRAMAVNADSVFLGCKHALPLLREAQPASIVNISSIAGLVAGHNYAAYNASKAAVWLLTKSVALHCARNGWDIRCNSVHPSFIRTPILDPLVERFGREQGEAKLARQVPLGRLGEPDDVAYAVLYLASDESRFMTGSELKLDGGLSAQ